MFLYQIPDGNIPDGWKAPTKIPFWSKWYCNATILQSNGPEYLSLSLSCHGCRIKAKPDGKCFYENRDESPAFSPYYTHHRGWSRAILVGNR
jgi:hypothetical protein